MLQEDEPRSGAPTQGCVLRGCEQPHATAPRPAPAAALLARLAAAATCLIALAGQAQPTPVAITPPHLGNPDAGTLPGELGVSPGGAATYSLPIDVPPGTAGLQPGLSLGYSSQGGNGPVGLGWSLGGLSSIHRCGKTIAQDGVNRPIRFDQGDRLCLDSQRLVLVNLAPSDANYWADNAEYRTEIDGLSRITAQLTNGVRSFKVEAANGRITTYGSTASSLVQAVIGPINSGVGSGPRPAKSGPLSWAIARIADRAGNHVSFSYEQDSTTGEHRPSAIRYGGAGLPAHAAVTFSHEARPDAWKRYVDEARNDLRSRVARIRTYVGANLDADPAAAGTLVREYTLQYEQSPTSGRSLLNAVQACARHPGSGSLQCLPATTFSWGKPDPAKTPSFVSRGAWPGGPVLTTTNTVGTSRVWAMHPEYFVFSDFTNDGFTDVLEKRVASPNTEGVSPTEYLREDANSIARGTRRTQYRYFHNHGSGFTQYNYRISTGEAFVVMSVGDFDGEGAPDLLVSTPAGARICLSPLGRPGALGSAGSMITFTCDAGRPAVGGNNVYELPYVVDVVGDGRAAHYSRANVNDSSATLCIQGSCAAAPSPPVSVLGYTYGFNGTTARDSINAYAKFEQMADFAGIGKPQEVRFTMPQYVPYWYDADGTQTYINSWENSQPLVYVAGFLPPGGVYAHTAVQGYAYPDDTPRCNHAACVPYTFNTGQDQAADFNASGYSGIVFGFRDMVYNPTLGRMVYVRNETTLCLSTGRSLDCAVRQKYTGANYLRVGTVGNFVGDGQATWLASPMTIPEGGTGDSTRYMCRVMGDDTTGGTGTDDTNIACDPWVGAHDGGYFMDVLGTGRTQWISYQPGAYDSAGVWREDGRWMLQEPLDLSLPHQALDRIHAVRNGIGATATVEYVDALPSGVVTRTAAGSAALSYPQRATPGTGKIVSRLRTSNGASAERSTTYRYQDPAIDVAGRGALGFAKVIVTDEQTRQVTTTTYAQVWPHTGQVLASTVQSSTGTVLSDTQNRPGRLALAHPNGTTTQCTFTAGSTATRRDLDGSSLGSVATGGVDGADVQYDSRCNLLKTRTVATGSALDAAATFTTTTVNTYHPFDTANWQPGLLQSTAVTRQQSGDTRSITRTRSFSYDAAGRGWLAAETLQPGDAALSLATSYGRSANPFGLIDSKTESWRDPLNGATVSRTSRTTYDPQGRYPLTQANALNHSQAHAHDPGSGAQTAHTGPSGLSTTWAVDGFGRVQVQRHADGTETRTHIKQCQADCPTGAAVAALSESYHGSSRIAVPQVVYSDSAGRVLRTLTWGFDGRAIISDQRYDALGRPYESDQPRYENEPAYLASRQQHDELNRVTAHTTLDEAGAERTLTTRYQGMVSVITNAKGQARTDRRDVLGQVRQVSDAKGGLTQFSYDAYGNLAKTVDPNGNVITVTHDDLGRRTDLRDPDLGWIHYSVDPAGRARQQVNPVQRSRGWASTMEYDLLDRQTARLEPDLDSRWTYDTAPQGTRQATGQLAEAYTLANGNKDYRRQHTYDSLGRSSQVTTTLDTAYSQRTEYDAWGRVSRQTWQRGSEAAKAYEHAYNARGYLSALLRNGQPLWQAGTQDAAQRITQAHLGNGLSQLSGYSPHSGRLQNGWLQVGAAGTTVKLQEGYQYDALGSVTRRTQLWDNVGFSETFDYDELNRLAWSQVAGQARQDFSYDAAGNLLGKTGVGSYTYPAQGATAVRPHAVQSIPGLGSFTYDDNGNLTAGAGRTATWSSFDMPVSIAKGAMSSGFVYGPEHQRVKQSRGDGTVIWTPGGQEVEVKAGQVTVKTYWPLGVGVEIDRPGQATELNWVHVDRLGSPIGISDSAGNLKEKLGYDAWGKRRTPDGSATPDSLDGITDNKGFTRHEMLDQLDLVHMNGRVYDPLTGRFISGDPLIGDPMNGQGYNRYSYVLNNPTNLTDPTGFCPEGESPMTGSRLCGVDTGAKPDISSPRQARQEPGKKSDAKGEKKDANGSTKADNKNSGGTQQGDKTATALPPAGAANAPGGPYLPPSWEDAAIGITIGATAAAVAAAGTVAAVQVGSFVFFVGGEVAAVGPAAAYLSSPLLYNTVAVGTVGFVAEVGTGTVSPASGAAQVKQLAKEVAKEVKLGSFSIVDWTGYPAASVPKPQGPFRLLEGAEYNTARDAANAANGAIRREQGLVGKAVEVHEVHPVKFGGSPTDTANKVVLPRDVHRQQVTPWWNQLKRDISAP
jgi:RHS repeat-associated protein